MSLFPIFVKLEGRLVVVIGGGCVAEAKIPGMLSAGARVRLIAPSITPQLLNGCDSEKLTGFRRNSKRRICVERFW